ncbi:MAG: TatD family deoxyribonuclease [Ruminococcaceae bacterium]|nr:TatD family deoxyribonuclease [Oscillospiraceae bacterium]
MSPIFDSHAHYDADAFDEDRAAVLAGLPAGGVCGVIQCATDPQSIAQSLKLAEQFPFIRVAVGIHPEFVNSAKPEWLDAVRQAAAHPAVCAIGEIGLDYYWEENAPREVQLQWCRKQIELAKELDLPVILHDREAHEDTLNLIRETRPRGVVHCFSGSAEMARQVTDLGMYVGLGGAVTFKNARKPVEVAASLPLDRLLLETDAPYMAPVPLRGKRCDSAMIAHTAARIAEIRGMELDTLLDATRENANRLFGLDL